MKIKTNIYLIAILWFLTGMFISSMNDILTKYLGSNIPPYEVVFFRFFFGTLAFVPFMMKDLNLFRTSRIQIHLIRGALLFGGILAWCVGLNSVKVTVATVINFTIPIFTIILASFFLKEKLNLFKSIATLLGFSGILVVINPTALEFDIASLVLLIGSIAFASLDVINKKFVNKEPMLSMLFYSGFFTMLFSFIPALNTWVTPSLQDLALFLLLGVGANLILYCVLKALVLVDVSVITPYHYTELVFSAALGYAIFGEIPNYTTLIGALIIIASTLLLAYEILIKRVIAPSRIQEIAK